MPVSGLPTNSALLKMTQGSSGVSTKFFQRTAKAPVGSLSVRTAVRPFARSWRRGTKATRHRVRPTDRTTTANCQGLNQAVRERALGNAVVLTDVSAAGSGRVGDAVRGQKISEYAPLGTSMIHGSAAPACA